MVRAARLHAHDRPVVIEDVELPEPGAGEVRVELAFGGVNPVDRYAAEGRVSTDASLPRTLGSEASGYLDGRPVLVAATGLGTDREGVWAGAAVVDEQAVVPLPDGVSLSDAAAMGVAGLTTWNTLQMAEVGAGDRVLVLGASGGVGLPIVSLAAALGASVWGQTGNEQKADAIRAQGAHAVVVTDAGGLADAVREWAPTVVLDSLGAAFTPAALSAMAPLGRLVLFGTSAGSTATLELRDVYRNGLRILGYAGLRLPDDERRAGLQAALGALADGRLRIPVDRVLPLEQVGEAFRLLADRAVAGKVLLDLRG